MSGAPSNLFYEKKMFRLKLIPHTPSFPFVKYFKQAVILSVVGIALSAFFFSYKGLNLGIDFKGGILIEARADHAVTIGLLRDELDQLALGDIAIQSFGSVRDVLIRVQRQSGDEQAQIKAIKTITDQLTTSKSAEGFTIRRTEFVGPTIGSELAEKGALAIACALFAILMYIWFRFEWQFSLAAIAAVGHDIIFTIGLFSVTGFEFNLATIAALLTIAGYSINDTVVVFDRLRENLRKYKSWTQEKIIDKSLNETLSRTVMTSVTTAIALLAIILFGGAVLRDFALAMLWGVIIGTYSSVFIAVGLVSHFNLRPSDSDTDDTPTAEYER